MPKAIAELSADSSVLISELSRMERGTVATYADHFSKWLGRPIRSREDMPNFSTVENRLLRDYQIHLSSQHGVGYLVCTHEQALKDNSRIERARKMARRRKLELSAVDASALPSEQARIELLGLVAQTHVVEQATSGKAATKLIAAVNGNTPLALAKAFDAIKGNV